MGGHQSIPEGICQNKVFNVDISCKFESANRQKIQSCDMHDTYTRTLSKAIYILMSSFPGYIIKKGNRK